MSTFEESARQVAEALADKTLAGSLRGGAGADERHRVAGVPPLQSSNR